MPAEVPPHVQKILGLYPKLIEQWKAHMALPCMQEPGWSGTLKRYLDSVYLRRVASEHCRLIEGDIERSPPIGRSSAARRSRRTTSGACSRPTW
jgi:hypothetical protein